MSFIHHNSRTSFCRPFFTPNCRSGFTLIELLVSSVIVVILVLILGGISSLVLHQSSLSYNRISNSSKMRIIFQLIARDLEKAVIRPDLAKFVDSNGNSSLTFYSQIRSYENKQVKGELRNLSLISYSWSSEDQNLKRIIQGIGRENQVDLLPFNQITRTPDLDLQNTEEIASAVIDFQWSFLNPTGMTSDYSPNPLSRAVRVTAAVIDQSMLEKISQNPSFEELKTKFHEATQRKSKSNDLDHLSLLAEWEKIIDDPSLIRSFPVDFRRSITLMERFYEIPYNPKYSQTDFSNSQN